MTYRHSKAKQAGDTIVEVVISVAVISSVLVGAFAVSSRSVQDIRDSEEHSEALQALQSQVELLRMAAGKTGTLSSFSLTSHYCLTLAGGILMQYADTSSQCIVGSLYHLSISGPPAPLSTSQTSTFNLNAQWNSILGGKDTVYLSYRVQVT